MIVGVGGSGVGGFGVGGTGVGSDTEGSVGSGGTGVGEEICGAGVKGGVGDTKVAVGVGALVDVAWIVGASVAVGVGSEGELGVWLGNTCCIGGAVATTVTTDGARFLNRSSGFCSCHR